MSASKWQWWAGHDEERMTVGPCGSREDIIAEGNGNFDEGFWIMEAQKWRLNVADFFDAEEFIERTEGAIYEEYGDPERDTPMFAPSPAEVLSLQNMLRIEIRRWQELHRIVVRPWAFAATRNEEWISQPEEEDAA